jgi:hypothetical protein
VGSAFTVWASSDAHVVREALAEGCDPARVPRESLRVAIEQAEGPEGFSYDLAFHLGDLIDYDHETPESFRLYRRQLAGSAKAPHAWYHLQGNNEENSVLNDSVAFDNEHYRRIIDPVGEFPETSGIVKDRRPFPVEGTYERYAFNAGNIRFLFLSDRNDLPAPYGRGQGGFYVDGAITLESFEWLARQVLTYPDRILVVACHHPLKNTTLGSGLDDSWRGTFMTWIPAGQTPAPDRRLQSVLHQVYPIHPNDSPLFDWLLGQNTGVVDLWLSGHVHHRLEQTFEGRGKYAPAYGGHHLNVGTLCRYRHFANILSAQSNVLSWSEGSAHVRSRVFVHDHPSLPAGFYAPEERALELKRPFQWDIPVVRVAPPPAPVAGLRFEPAGPGRFRLAWDTAATGALLLESGSAAPAFRPADDAVYSAGQSLPEGVLLFAGRNRAVDVPAARTGNRRYIHAFAYQAGGGRIRYQSGPPVTLVLEPGPVAGPG